MDRLPQERPGRMLPRTGSKSLPIFSAATLTPSASRSPRPFLRKAIHSMPFTMASAFPNPEFHPLGVGLGQDALLIALHNKPDGHARGKGIQGISVAELTPLEYSRQVIHKKERTQSAQRFISRPAVFTGSGIRPRRNFHRPPAARRRHSLFCGFQDRLGHLFWLIFLPREDAIVKISFLAKCPGY